MKYPSGAFPHLRLPRTKLRALSFGSFLLLPALGTANPAKERIQDSLFHLAFRSSWESRSKPSLGHKKTESSVLPSKPSGQSALAKPSVTAASDWEAVFYPQGPNSDVFCLAVSGDSVFAGGLFSRADDKEAFGVGVWNGSEWQPLGRGVRSVGGNHNVRDLLKDSTGLYVAGSFDTAGTVPCQGMAHWDGKVWKCMDGGLPKSTRVLTRYGDILYAGGNYGVRRWDGQNWQEVGVGFEGGITAMVQGGGDLYVGGSINLPGVSLPHRGVSRWNGTTWSAIGGSDTRGVDQLVWFRDQLFVLKTTVLSVWKDSGLVELMSRESGMNPDYLATDGQEMYLLATNTGTLALIHLRWNGAGFERVGEFATGVGFTYDAKLADGRLLIGGGRVGAGNTQADRVMMWDGMQWKGLTRGLAPGPDRPPIVMRAVGSKLVMGSDLYLRFAGGLPAGAVSSWNGTTWDNLGGGFKSNATRSAAIYSIAAGPNGELYCGGSFDSSQTGPAANVARWDGRVWQALGDGFPGLVRDMAAWNGSMFVAGYPDSTRSHPYAGHSLLQWDGANWQSVGAGFRHDVRLLASITDGIYLGGQSPGNFLSRWDGSTLTVLPPAGSEITIERVYDLESFKNEIFLIGEFTRSTTYSNVARWNGSRLEDFPEISSINFSPSSNRMTHDESRLYLIGKLRGEEPGPYRVLAWDGAAWKSVGPPVDVGLEAMEAFGNHLYISSGYSTISGQPFYQIARWNTGTGTIHLAGAGGIARGNRLPRLLITLTGSEVGDMGLGPKFDMLGRRLPSLVLDGRWNSGKQSAGVRLLQSK